MELEIPGCDEGSKNQISGNLEMRRAKLREAKAEPARVMELELPYRCRMRARISGFAGLRNIRKRDRDVLSVSEFGEPRDLVRTRPSFEATAEEW